MPSPVAYCTTLAELQALVSRICRAYPDLERRALAAGAVIAADRVSPDPGYRLFRVQSPSRSDYRVDLANGSCSCPDDEAPIRLETKLCEHTIACLIVLQLAERAEQLLAFNPSAWKSRTRCHGTDWTSAASWWDTCEQEEADIPRNTFTAFSADQQSAHPLCLHPISVATWDGFCCGACGAHLDGVDGEDVNGAINWSDEEGA